jgi:hypothetical protein
MGATFGVGFICRTGMRWRQAVTYSDDQPPQPPSTQSVPVDVNGEPASRTGLPVVGNDPYRCVPNGLAGKDVYLGPGASVNAFSSLRAGISVRVPQSALTCLHCGGPLNLLLSPSKRGPMLSLAKSVKPSDSTPAHTRRKQPTRAQKTIPRQSRKKASRRANKSRITKKKRSK